MKKVLMISPLWTGMKDFFLKAKDGSSGMPAFYNIFSRMLRDRRIDSIYLILFSGQKFFVNIPQKYKYKLIIFPFFYRNKIELIFKIMISIVKSLYLIKRNKINICYGHGDVGAIAGVISLFSKIPNIRRIYGTFLYNEISKIKLLIFLRHPLEYLLFSLPAKHIIITNDGSKGDEVFKYIGNKKSELHFLLNGVDKNMDKRMTPPSFTLPNKYISYISRIDLWKRQHLVIEALGILKKEGLIIPLYIVGPFSNLSYYNFLKKLLKENGLEEYIYFTDVLTHEVTWFVLKKSYFTLSLYEGFNLSNVFLESITLGTPIISLDNNTLVKNFPRNIFYHLKSDKPVVIANAIKELWLNQKKRDQISLNAKKFTTDRLLDWEKRSNIEIDLVLNSN